MTSATATTKTYARPVRDAGTATVATRKIVKEAPAWYKFGEGAAARVVGWAVAGFVVLMAAYCTIGAAG